MSRPTFRISVLCAAALAVLAFAGCNEAAPPGQAAAVVEPEALLEAMKGASEKILVLDVRTEAEYQSGHVPGAVNIPVDQVESRIDEVRGQDPERVVVYCERGGRATKAEEALRAAGIANVQQLSGNMQQWRSRGLPQEQTAAPEAPPAPITP